ncbi:MAG: hydrogenase [Acidobacteriota bacterium]
MTRSAAGHRLLQLGVVLFLLGLLVGFAIPALPSPRMGLTSHLEGVMNGLFLIVLGLVWPRLALSPRLLDATFWLALYGTFANWLATLLAAMWEAGGMMPVAGQGRAGAAWAEGVVGFLLISLSVAMVLVCGFVLVGLRGGGTGTSDL